MWNITSIQEYSHISAFSDLSFLMDYIEPRYKKAFKSADYLYDSTVHIDRECQIGRFFFISCTASIFIHPNVVISERVFLGDNNHTFSHPNVPIMQQPNQKGNPVEIKKGAWIGVGVAILKGTSFRVRIRWSVPTALSRGSFPTTPSSLPPGPTDHHPGRRIADVERQLCRTICQGQTPKTLPGGIRREGVFGDFIHTFKCLKENMSANVCWIWALGMAVISHYFVILA